MSVHNRIYEARSRSWIWLDKSTSYAIIVIETYEHQGWEKIIGKFLHLRSTAMFQSKIHNSAISSWQFEDNFWIIKFLCPV